MCVYFFLMLQNPLWQYLGQSYRYLLPFEIGLCFLLPFELLVYWYFFPPGWKSDQKDFFLHLCLGSLTDRTPKPTIAKLWYIIVSVSLLSLFAAGRIGKLGENKASGCRWRYLRKKTMTKAIRERTHCKGKGKGAQQRWDCTSRQGVCPSSHRSRM